MRFYSDTDGASLRTHALHGAHDWDFVVNLFIDTVTVYLESGCIVTWLVNIKYVDRGRNGRKIRRM